MHLWRESIPVIILMVVMGIILGMVISTTFAIWAGIAIGVIVLLFVTIFIGQNVVVTRKKSHKNDTKAQKVESRRSSHELSGFFLKCVGFIFGALLVLVIPVGLFILFFPTYPELVTAVTVVVIVVGLLYLYWLAKRGGDLTNEIPFWHWWS